MTEDQALAALDDILATTEGHETHVAFDLLTNRILIEAGFKRLAAKFLHVVDGYHLAGEPYPYCAPLPPMRAEVLRFLRSYWLEYGQGPSLGDLRSGTGVASASHMTEILDDLAERGLIERKRNAHRGNRPVLRELTPTTPTKDQDHG